MNLSKKFNINPIHLALSFCASRPFIGSVIFGATNNTQLDLIIKGLDIELTDDMLLEIGKIYKNFGLTF